MDTVLPLSGIQYKEERVAITSQQIFRVDISKRHGEKEIDMGDYYSSVRFIKLQHPEADEGGRFLADVNYYITLNKKMFGDKGFSSFFLPCDGRIIAGDKFYGYQSYNLSGEFERTIIRPENEINYNASKRSITMKINDGESYLGYIMSSGRNSIGVFGENCVYLSSWKGKQYFELYNLSTGKVIKKRPLEASAVTMLNAETIVSYEYDVLNREREGFMYTFNIKGDTLCDFTNYNQLPVSTPKTYSNPQELHIYHYDDILTIWQPYNDTVFRMTSPHKLVPVYTVAHGDRKMDLETALYGKKDDKLIPGLWLETPDFVYISCSEGDDSPNSRRSGNVKFYYAVYDKKNGEMFNLSQSCFPEEVIFNNSISDGIPVLASMTKYYKDKLYTSYSKSSLDKMIKSNVFNHFSKEQQEKIKLLHNNLSEKELLIMILE